MKHDTELATMSVEDLANLGSEQVAYMKKMLSDDVINLIPEASDIPKAINVWVLFAANGKPLALADDPGEVFSSAFHHDLKPVSVH